ncbi:hypothetical protein Taro_039308 [Colocasia esculenta]|uniref:Uncharacterized protein n=1 Tax=Colocasia esculenta TaxID=4460 RepID=A0A843WR62_COLES|nr:hypothetical protein [Colocasia esculenta]
MKQMEPVRPDLGHEKLRRVRQAPACGAELLSWHGGCVRRTGAEAACWMEVCAEAARWAAELGREAEAPGIFQGAYIKTQGPQVSILICARNSRQRKCTINNAAFILAPLPGRRRWKSLEAAMGGLGAMLDEAASGCRWRSWGAADLV